MQRRALLTGGAAAVLTGCAAGPSVWAPDDVIAARRAPGFGPTALRLFTMKNTGSDNGNHTGLLINASQRVIWDPAGTFGHPTIPERNDLHFGITPRVEDFYISYHARETYYVVTRKIAVPPQVAEAAMLAFMSAGPVAQANCTRVTSQVLRGLPGMGWVPQTWFPDKLDQAFAARPGVETGVFRENDSDDKSLALATFPG